MILIAKDGHEIWHAAYGKDASGSPYGLDSPLEIMSVTKMFTAVAIAQLVDAGRLRFDDRLDAYVKPVWAGSNSATIAELLTHTAGLDGPRGSFAYSNNGFLILGQIIEKITGDSYQDDVQKHVFDPAGMTSTGAIGEPVAGIPSSAYGQRSSASDLLRFMNAFFGGDLLPGEMVDLVTTSKVADESASGSVGYGYGFWVLGTDEDLRTIGGFGVSGDVVKAEVNVNPALGYTELVVCDYGFDKIDLAMRDYMSAIGMPYWAD